MIFNTGKIYAKVWKIKRYEKYLDLQVTTSEKDDEGNYKNSSWFPRCIGKSLNTLKNLKEGDRICITKSKFTNERYEAEDGTLKSYFKFLVLEASIADENGSETPAMEKAAEKKTASAPKTSEEVAAEDEDCPW